MSALGVTLSVAVTACGGGQESSSSSPETAESAAAAPAGGGAGRVDAATAGSIMGMVSIDGMAPDNEPIRMNADPVCVQQNSGTQYQETFVVGEGNSLGNVFVYVKDGLGNYVFDPPTDSVTLDQQGCRYIPHVFGIRVGQELVIVNSDPTLHNVHATPVNNTEFNNGQPIQGMKMTHAFTSPEVMLPFKCDVHGWMNAYVGVMDHPYFAVTAADGKFELPGLPPGTYTIEAWHERLGTTTQSVTIGASETGEANFTFQASGA
jgi:plastocyanin